MKAKSKAKPRASKHKTKPREMRWRDNLDGTLTLPGTARIECNYDHRMMAVMTLRGFPEGMPLDEFRSEASCNAASPGIADAHRNVSGGLHVECMVTIDKYGNRTIELGRWIPEELRRPKEPPPSLSKADRLALTNAERLIRTLPKPLQPVADGCTREELCSPLIQKEWGHSPPCPLAPLDALDNYRRKLASK